MIHKDRKNLKPCDELEPKKHNERIEKLLKEKDQYNFNSKPAYIEKSHADLKKLYRYKCGYCEKHVRNGKSLEIDHYRPKGKITGESHQGYYWLFLEWTNMIPACRDCNLAKHENFPIKGERIITPPMNNNSLDMIACKANSDIHLNEKPLLLHPEVDIPENYLEFLPNGKIKGISKKGETSVEIYKLNRDEVSIARKGLIDSFYNAISTLLHKLIQKELNSKAYICQIDLVFMRLKRAQRPHRPFSRLGFFIFDDFETFIVQRFETDGKMKSAKKIRDDFSLFIKYGTCRKQQI